MIKIWLQAARLRTLPLSFSGIISGTALASLEQSFDLAIFLLSLWCTLLFQVISNFANDYGDGVKGTDNAQRVGPQRMLQTGALSARSLKKAIIFLSVLSVGSVIMLLSYVFGIDQWPLFVLFLGLGVFSIWSAIKYTVGKSAYGYKGLGDVFVFLFFGILGVVGSAFLFTHEIMLTYFLAAIVIGALSVAVLNLNNMRDHINDKASHKNTLVVRYGFQWAKKYQLFLVGIAAVSSTFLFWISDFSLLQWCPSLVFIFLLIHSLKVIRVSDPVLLDPELKKVALLTFLWSILFILSSNNLL